MYTWALLLLPLLLLQAANQPQSQILNITLTIYGDGAVRVKEDVQVNSTSTEVRIQTLGLLVTDIVLQTDSGEVIKHTYQAGLITAETLGSSNLKVSYTTSELTSKNGNRWRLTASLPAHSVVKLPDASTIVNLDPLPTGISNVGITTTLLMPAGNITVEYYIGITGTEEHALALLNDLDETIQGLKQQGYNTTLIDIEYTQAKQAYQSQQYIEAETLTMRANDDATLLKETADKASDAIAAADVAIMEAESQGRTANLTHASELLTKSKNCFKSGEYTQALNWASSAKQWAVFSKTTPNLFLTWLLIICSILGAFTVGIYLYKRRKPSNTTMQISLKANLEQMRKDHPEIREDDLPALNFIANHPEGVYMSKLRDSINMPRSTAWRTVSRLEETGVIKTQQLGRETFILISDKYLHS